MKRDFSELSAALRSTPEGAAQVEAAEQRLAEEVAAYHRTLPQLRKAREKTQQELAGLLGTSQGEVSRIERRADLYFSTLQAYVEALGGRLELTAVFGEDRVPLRIGDLSDEDTEGTAGAVAAA